MDYLFSTHALVVAILVFFGSWFIKYHNARRRRYLLAAEFNGPRPLPIIGDVLKCLITNSELISTVLKSTKYYKSPQRFWLGSSLVVHVFDPEDAKIILNSPHALEKQPHIYKILESIVGSGILTSPVAVWKCRRKLIGPCFNQKFLDGCFDAFCCYSVKLVDSLEIKAGKGVFNIEKYLLQYSMCSTMETLLGFTENKSTSIHNVANWIDILMAAVSLRILSIWYYSDTVFELSATGRHALKVKKMYDAYIDSILENWKRHSLEKLGQNGEATKEVEPHTSKKLAELMLAVSDGNGKLTAEELRGEVTNILVGGLETTATTLGFLLIVLGIYPEVQERIYQEVTEAMGSKQKLELDDLKNLQYLERVIKESLRLFPPAPGIARNNNQEIQLTNHIVPTNTTIVIGIMALHRNAAIWSNPNKFDPDRFLPENIAKQHPYSWIPFSAGPRNCIGIRFGLMSMKIVLCHLIMKYKITTDYKDIDDIQFSMLLKLTPTKGYKIEFALR